MAEMASYLSHSTNRLVILLHLPCLSVQAYHAISLLFQWVPPHLLLVATLHAQVDMSLRPAQSLLARSLRPCKPLLLSPPKWGKWQSNRASQSVGQGANRSAWTTGRVLLLSAFVSSLTYVLGVTDAGSHIEEISSSNSKDLRPQYGSAKELDKVNIACVMLTEC